MWGRREGQTEDPRGVSHVWQTKDLQTAILEVWQVKDLRANFTDLWQINGLAAFLQEVGICAEGLRSTARPTDIS